jgi:hypothetical protein
VGGDVRRDGHPDVREPVEHFLAHVRRQLGPYIAPCNPVTAESAERRDHLAGQMSAAQRYRSDEHQSVNLVRVPGGDELGDLCAEALADHDHRSADTCDDVAGLVGEGIKRRTKRFGDRPAAAAEPRQVVAHGADLIAEGIDQTIPHRRVVEEAMDQQERGCARRGHCATFRVEPDGDHSSVSMVE